MRNSLVVIFILCGSLFGQTVGKGKMVGQATASPQSAGGDAFALFVANEPSVISSNGFNVSQTHTTTSVTTNGVVPLSGTSTYADTLDTSTKVNGSGSLRFDLPASCAADCSGFYRGNVSASPFSTQCGNGSECYVSYMFRVTSSMISNAARNGAGWKQSIFGLGAYNTAGTDYPPNSCTEMELTLNEFGHSGFPSLYHSCGLKDNQYQGIYPVFASTNFELQPGYDDGSGSPCAYGDLPLISHCLPYQANTWYQFIYHIKPCTPYVNLSKNYTHCSVVEVWAGALGSALQLIVSHPYYDLNLHTYDGDWVSGTTPPGLTTPKYGTVWLGNYETGRCANVVQASTLARDAAGIVTVTTTTVPSWISQNGNCVLNGDTIVFAGFSDSSFNVSGTAITQVDNATITVQTSVLGAATTINTQTGTVTDSTAPATASAQTWYDNLVVTTRRPPDWQATTPCPPDNLTVTNNGTNDTVSWRDNSDVYSCPARTGWTVQQAAGDIFKDVYANFGLFSGISTSGLSCSGTPSICTLVVAGAGSAKHTYRVRATNGAGNSGWSNAATNVPGIPSDVTVAVNSSTSVTVTWTQNNPNDVDHYVVERCADTVGNCGNPVGAGSYSNVTSAATCCTYTDTTPTGVGQNQAYSYRVKAVNNAGAIIDWGDQFYSSTSYGGGTSTAQTPILSQNNAGLLGSSSILAQGPGGSFAQSVPPCPDVASIQLSTACPFGLYSWTSAVYRTAAHMMVQKFVGGHADYGGNEGYQMTVAVSSGKFAGTTTRLQVSGVDDVPTTPIDANIASVGNFSVPSSGGANCVDNGTTHDNCKPGDRHTYTGMAYVPPSAVACNGITGDAMYLNGGITVNNAGSTTASDAWVYPFNSSDTLYPKALRLDNWWTKTGGTYQPGTDSISDWYSGYVWTYDAGGTGTSGTATLWQHDICTNAITSRKTITQPSGTLNGATGVIDQNAGKMLIWFPDSTTTRKFYTVLLANPYTVTDITGSLTGCTGLTAGGPVVGTFWTQYPGMAFNSDKNVIGIWPSWGNDFWELDLNANTCSKVTLSGATIPTAASNPAENGAFHRLGYDPTYHIYVLEVTDPTKQGVAICTQSSGCF
jgi:hypothetical protein